MSAARGSPPSSRGSAAPLRPLLASLGGRIPRRYAELFERGGSWAGAYRLRRGLFGEWELPAILGQELARDGLRSLDPDAVVLEAITPDPGGSFARVSALEAGLYMRNQLLRDTDWASMAHSLEVRVPLVDVPLWRRLTARLGPDGLGRGKRLLAQAPRPPIPEGQLRRPKTGFYVPVWEWAGEAPGLDAWRGVSALTGPGPQGPRRWAYTVFKVLAADLGVPAR